MKKYVAFVLAFVGLSFGTIFAYSDIDGHWAEKSINTLSTINVIEGYSDDSFKPNNNMTRAELVTIVNRLLKNFELSNKYVPDNNENEWFYNEIRKAIASGIIEGNTSGYVKPNDYITREEAIVILQRAFVENVTSNALAKYSDENRVATWAKDSVNTFLEKGYVNGYTDGTLKPKGRITRAEVVSIVNRMFGQIIFSGEYLQDVSGNLLLSGDNISLKDFRVYGDLVITEGVSDNIKLDDIIVEGNLILRRPFEFSNSEILVRGNVVNLYEQIMLPEVNTYVNSEYGISFAVPDNANVVEITDDSTEVNYRKKNLITIEIEKSEDLHFVSFDRAAFYAANKFDNLYNEVERDNWGLVEYAVYKDSDDSYLVFIKRFDVTYSIYCFNLSKDNVVENLVNTIFLFEGPQVQDHKLLSYKNRNLFLEFSYLDYVGVDDSYHTGNIYEGDSYFKLFIQVTNITDLKDYTLEELRVALQSLEGADVEILDSDIKKAYIYDAIEYTVKDGDKRTKSLYVIVETKLYHFIFVGDEDKMVSIGDEIFDDIVSSIQF